LTRTHRILLAFFAASIAIGWLCFDERLSRLGDNAEFIDISKGIVTGHGMSFVHGPEPEAARKFPPGYPSVLAVTQLISPDNINLMKSVSVLFFALAIPLVWLVIREIDTEGAATVVALTAMVSPHLIEYSHQVLSEVPYCAFSLATLLFLLKHRDAEDWKKLIVVVLLAVASYYIRTIGLTAIGVVVCTQWLDRRYKTGFKMGVVAFLLILPWVLMSTAYFDQLSSINPYKTETDPGLSIIDLVTRLQSNVVRYGLLFLPNAFAPFMDYLRDTGFHVDALAVTTDLLFAYFIIMTVRRSRKEAPLGVYLSLYMIVVLLWPTIWSDTRFVIPIIPLAIYGIFWSSRDLLSRLSIPDLYKSRIPYTIAIAVLLANGTRSATTQIDHPPYIAPWRNYFDCAEWIKHNTPEDALIVCRKPFLMNVVSGRKTMGYPWLDPAPLADSLHAAGVDYVVSDALFSQTRRYLNPSIMAHPESFLRAHMYPESRTMVFEFLGREGGEDLRRVQEKREQLEAHLDRAPSDMTRWRQLYSIGTIFHQKGKRAKAIEVYEKVLPHMGETGLVWHNLGILHQAEGRFEQAVEAYRSALAKSRKNPRIMIGLAESLESLKQYDESMTHARAAIGLDNKNANAYHILGRSAIGLENYKDAETAYKTALRLSPESLQIGNDLASLLIKVARAREARELLKQMIAMNPRRPALRLNLIVALVNLDALDDAKKELSHVLTNHVAELSGGGLRVATSGVIRQLATKLNVDPQALVKQLSAPQQ
jgi:tetratricopeptide (TPR) repeat protein